MSFSENTDAPWRVGVLFSQTGVTSAIEQSQLNAALLAIEEINSGGGVLDRMVQPVIYDPASDPKQFRSLAERLFQVDRIRMLFGCYMSSTRKAVLPVVESHRGLLFYPTLYEGFEYSRHCIYTGAAPNQNSLQLAKFLLSTYGNRFLLVGSNYIYPYESNRLMADFASGGLYAADRLTLDLVVGAGAALNLTTQASTVVHDARGQGSTMCQSVTVKDNAFCAIISDPYVLFPGADLHIEALDVEN